jgi:glucose-6-phosphate isomerase
VIQAVSGSCRVRVYGTLADRVDRLLPRMAEDKVPTGIIHRRTSLWPPAIAADVVSRMAWLDLPATSAGLPALVDRIAAERTGLDLVVLLGMGGSSLAAEAISAAAGRPLRVLDTTDPGQVRATLSEDPAQMLIVLSSKSGETIESESLSRIFLDHLRRHLGEAEAARHVVAVTDPGSRLHELATQAGYATVLSDPMVGGRFSALGPFGLAAAGLRGVDIATVIRDATAVHASLAGDTGNAGLLLGAALGEAARHGRDKLFLMAGDAALHSMPDWVEQLISESTGKDGRGILPVVGPTGDTPADAVRVRLGACARGDADVVVEGPPGAQFLLWEFAVTLICRQLRVHPFDQPHVEESKANTRAVLAGDHVGTGTAPALRTDAVEVYSDGQGRFEHLREVFDGPLRLAEPDGYLAVMAFLDSSRDRRITELVDRLRALTTRPVTFGWGPRFLHSSGQLHKGGPSTGVFLQITGAADEDVPIPGRPFTLGQLQAAQAEGDRLALARRGRHVLRIHLRNRQFGIRELIDATS